MPPPTKEGKQREKPSHISKQNRMHLKLHHPIITALPFLNYTYTHPPTHQSPPPWIPLVPAIATCPLHHSRPCHNTTQIPNPCCNFSPHYRIQLSQVWEGTPVMGPEHEWAMHRLWSTQPCDGDHKTVCQSSVRIYHNVSRVLQDVERGDLLRDMETFWVPKYGSFDHPGYGSMVEFWDMEWRDKGMCVDTLTPGCYRPGEYVVGDELVDYFARGMDLFHTFNVSRALARAGIVPTEVRQYAYDDVVKALGAMTGGVEVGVACKMGKNMLQEVWFAFEVRGSLQSGEWTPVPPVGRMRGKRRKGRRRGGCQRRVWYFPKDAKGWG